MPENIVNEPNTLVPLTSYVVSAYVSNHRVGATELPELIAAVQLHSFSQPQRTRMRPFSGRLWGARRLRLILCVSRQRRGCPSCPRRTSSRAGTTAQTIMGGRRRVYAGLVPSRPGSNDWRPRRGRTLQCRLLHQTSDEFKPGCGMTGAAQEGSVASARPRSCEWRDLADMKCLAAVPGRTRDERRGGR
jgi:hypothetical protein